MAPELPKLSYGNYYNIAKKISEDGKIDINFDFENHKMVNLSPEEGQHYRAFVSWIDQMKQDGANNIVQEDNLISLEEAYCYARKLSDSPFEKVKPYFDKVDQNLGSTIQKLKFWEGIEQRLPKLNDIKQGSPEYEDVRFKRDYIQQEEKMLNIDLNSFLSGAFEDSDHEHFIKNK